MRYYGALDQTGRNPKKDDRLTYRNSPITSAEGEKLQAVEVVRAYIKRTEA